MSIFSVEVLIVGNVNFLKKCIDSFDLFYILGSSKGYFAKSYYGGIAQLGERLNGIQKVSGSIPLTSTKKTPQQAVFFLFR